MVWTAPRWVVLGALGLTVLITGALISGPGAAGSAGPSIPNRDVSSDRVVVFGIPGLRWSDISAGVTPTIWRLLDEGSAAVMSVRTVRPRACPIDGWLTLGAGARTLAPRLDDQCVPPVAPVADAGQTVVPGFDAIIDENADFSYDPHFGLVADAVVGAGGCVTAAGPGAASAVADSSGRVGQYVDDLSVLGPEGLLDACAVTLVDLGTVPDGDADESTAARDAFLRRADAEIARVAAGLSPHATVMVAGIADRSPRPHLSAVIVAGPDYQGGWLTASSTRQDGMVQLTDLSPTILAAVGVAAPDSMVGAAMEPAGGRPADVRTAWQRLAQADVAAQTIRDYAGHFFILLELGQILLYVVVALVLGQRRMATGGSGVVVRDGLPARLLYVGALFVGSAPAASFLANLAPWWRAVHPAPVLGALVLGWTLVLAILALIGPWRRWHLLGPAGFVAIVTVAVLAVDVSLAESRLQLSSLYGLSPLIAGRFYGFGNVAFAVFAMASLFAALAAGAYWLSRANRRAALTSVALIGLAAVVVDGWPRWGADFGGVIAMVPGFALLALAAAGVRPSARTILAMAAGAVAAVTALAMLDWLRPADQRSHLGRFVQDVLDGSAGDIVQRKIDANVATFTRGPEGIAIPVIMAVVAYLLARPERLRTFKEAIERVPIMRPGLVSMYVTAVLGFAVNDSGIQVAAVCLVVAVPLVVATCARLLGRSQAIRRR